MAGPVIGDDLFHQRAAREQVVVIVGGKVEGVACGEFTGAARGVVVNGESPELTAFWIGIEDLKRRVVQSTSSPLGPTATKRSGVLE